MKAVTVVLFLCVSVAVLTAQDAGMMKHPGPGPERMKLAFLTGTFTTKAIMPPGPMNPQEVVANGTSTMSFGVDSMFILLDDQSENPILGHYKAHGVLGYNPMDKQYTLSMYNNFGDAPQYKGSFSGDTLVLTSKIDYPGGSFNQKLDWFQEGSGHRIRVYNDMGKGSMLVIDQTYVRTEGK